jgi:hypothetical protein
MTGPLPAVSKVVRLDLHWTEGTAGNLQCREFFQFAGTLSVADAVTWGANISTAIGTYMTSFMHSGVTLTHLELTDLTSTSAAQVINGTGHTGANGGTALPSGTALVIKKIITRRYRGGHPRIYLPGTVQADLATPNTWGVTPLANIVAAWTTFINACIANTNPAAIGAITHVNVSFYSGFTNHTYPSGRVKPIPTPRVTPVVDAVQGLVGNSTVASQRRRNQQ